MLPLAALHRTECNAASGWGCHFPTNGVNATVPLSWPVSTAFPSFVNTMQYPGDLIAFVNFGFSLSSAHVVTWPE